MLSASETVSLAGYFSSVSTKDYVTASFRSTERGKTVKQPVRRSREHRLESNGQAQADKENVQVAPVHALAEFEEPTGIKSIRCQYTVKQKQHIVLHARHH